MKSSSRASLSIGRLVLDAVIVAALLHLMLLAAWLSNGVLATARVQTKSALQMHAVVRAGVTEEQAQGLASRIGNLVTEGSARLIGLAEARGLLALQEPWMKSLPDVEIGRLPLLVEIRLPLSTDDPAKVRALAEQVRAEPETSFLIFNDNGLEDLLSFNRNIAWYTTAAQQWIVFICTIGMVLYAARTAFRPGSITASFAQSVIVFVVAVLSAWIALRVFGARAAEHYRLPPVSLPSAWRELILAAVCWILPGLILPMLSRRTGELPTK